MFDDTLPIFFNFFQEGNTYIDIEVTQAQKETYTVVGSFLSSWPL